MLHGCLVSCDIYGLHSSNFRVRQGEAYDLTAIFDICERAPHAQVLIDLFESAINSFTLECYVMLSQNQPVGMVVIG